MATPPLPALARQFSLRRTRRATFSSAVGGLAGLVGLGARPEVAAARCSAGASCLACHRCHKGRCKALPDGAACDGGTCVEAVCAPPKTTAHALATEIRRGWRRGESSVRHDAGQYET